MYKVAVADLQPGMCLGKSVTTAYGTVLLKAGVPLRPKYIEQLRRLEVPAVYVSNPLAPDLEPPDVVAERTRTRLGGELGAVTEQVRRTFEARERGQQRRWASDMAGLNQQLQGLVEELIGNPNALVHLRDIRAADDYTLGHSVNVCILATLLGVSRGLPAPRLRDLALGALLHDVGKVCIPAEILQKDGQLSEQERVEMRQHTTRGFEVLRRNPEVSLLAAHVAFQHHEKWGGGGYPRGLKSTEILEYARIVTVADVYDALVSDRVYRCGLPPRRALHIMLEGSPGFFEPELVREFAGRIAIYPIGSIVRLSDNCIAVVVEVRRGRVETPVVRVAKGPDGRLLENPFDVDLSQASQLTIVEVLVEENSTPAPPEEEVADISV